MNHPDFEIRYIGTDTIGLSMYDGKLQWTLYNLHENDASRLKEALAKAISEMRGKDKIPKGELNEPCNHNQ